MILLKGHSLTPERRVPLEALSLQLNERSSTATMVPADMTGITVGAWLQDDTEPGKGIVWRVKSIRTLWGTQTTTVQLEHAIQTLKDRILFGEHKAEQITGKAKATTATATQAIRYILKEQSDWTLGTCAFTDANPYKFDGDSLLDAVELVSDSLEDSWWAYDFSVYPFKLNIVKKSENVGTVMRCGRNITALAKNIDRGGMITRFYPIGKSNLKLPEKYLQKNTEAYGVVSRVETDQSLDTVEELRAWANERLRKHAEPVVTIEVDGLELSAATGESMDRLKLGEKCRIPLSEFGSEITETITSLTYSDKLHSPEAARITLANNRTDITKILADNMKRGGKGGRGAAKQQEEDMAWFEDTTDHVAMCAKAIAGEGAETDWTRLSQIVVDGEGIHQRVVKTEDGLVSAWSAIEVNESAITLETNRRISEDNKLNAKITVQADRISAEVTNRQNAVDSLSGRIDVESSRISLVVSGTGANAHIKPAEIVAAINNGSSEIKISADHIHLDGETIADMIRSHEINVGRLTCSSFESNSSARISGNITCNGQMNTTSMECSGRVATDGLAVNGTTVSWQSFNLHTYTLGAQHRFLWEDSGGASGYVNGRIITDDDQTIIHYLGR